MADWFWYAVVAAIFYGAHQIFTRLAAERIGDGLGGFIVEASAALSILIYLAILWLGGRWNQRFSAAGFNYSLVTGVCVGAGTVFFVISERWTAFGRSSNSRRRCRNHGRRWNFVFSRIALVATPARNRARDRRIIFVAQIGTTVRYFACVD
jgi:hypothetical protein